MELTLPPQLDTGTALRYLGAAGWTPDDGTARLLAGAESALRAAATPRGVWRRLPLSALPLAGAGRDLARHLQDCTGLVLMSHSRTLTHWEETAVTFYPLSREMIDWYLSTGEPMDKAGSYGIQGKGALLVQRVEGDFYNVVGLPLAPLARLFSEMGLPWAGEGGRGPLSDDPA